MPEKDPVKIVDFVSKPMCTRPRGNVMAVTSLILGVSAPVFALSVFWYPVLLLFSVAAIALGITARYRLRSSGAKRFAIANAGIVFGCIGLVLCMAIACYIVVISRRPSPADAMLPQGSRYSVTLSAAGGYAVQPLECMVSVEVTAPVK